METDGGTRGSKSTASSKFKLRQCHPMSETETILAGGRTTLAVARVGETVRRPPTPNCGFVRSLLWHLDAVGFDGAPRYLGSDDAGREIFTYIRGAVPAMPD